MSLQPDALAPPAAVAGASPSRAGVRVQLVELRRRFGEVSALDGLSLDLAPGELVALLGPSGCGKTTALRSLAGLERLDSGRVLLDGRDITEHAGQPARHGHGVPGLQPVPASDGARERRLRPAPAAHGGSASGARSPTGCSSSCTWPTQGNRYPHELSGGQQQRVALARALAIEPQVLLLDEPLSALDAKVRSALRDEIRRIQTEVGITTVFVTHDQDEALAIADRVAVIFAGRVAQIAPPAELYERPRSAQVADFVGLSNRIRGEAKAGTAAVLDARLPLLEGSADRRAGDGPGPARGGRAAAGPERARTGSSRVELPGLDRARPGAARRRHARAGAGVERRGRRASGTAMRSASG